MSKTTLEGLLDQITAPKPDDDWDLIAKFCELVHRERDGCVTGWGSGIGFLRAPLNPLFRFLCRRRRSAAGSTRR